MKKIPRPFSLVFLVVFGELWAGSGGGGAGWAGETVFRVRPDQGTSTASRHYSHHQTSPHTGHCTPAPPPVPPRPRPLLRPRPGPGLACCPAWETTDGSAATAEWAGQQCSFLPGETVRRGRGRQRPRPRPALRRQTIVIC